MQRAKFYMDRLAHFLLVIVEKRRQHFVHRNAASAHQRKLAALAKRLALLRRKF